MLLLFPWRVFEPCSGRVFAPSLLVQHLLWCSAGKKTVTPSSSTCFKANRSYLSLAARPKKTTTNNKKSAAISLLYLVRDLVFNCWPGPSLFLKLDYGWMDAVSALLLAPIYTAGSSSPLSSNSSTWLIASQKKHNVLYKLGGST